VDLPTLGRPISAITGFMRYLWKAFDFPAGARN
jgi:hypothetical protein